MIPTLVRLAIEDPDESVRRKAIRALSSSVRNYQPGLNNVIDHLPPEYRINEKLDASDMDSVDRIVDKLRHNSDTMRKP